MSLRRQHNTSCESTPSLKEVGTSSRFRIGLDASLSTDGTGINDQGILVGSFRDFAGSHAGFAIPSQFLAPPGWAPLSANSRAIPGALTATELEFRRIAQEDRGVGKASCFPTITFALRDWRSSAP